jgi:beta-glucosidase
VSDPVFVEELVASMSLAEKVGQMTQVEKYSITPDEVAEHGIGSVLSGGGGNPEPNTPEAWTDMVGAFQEGALRSRLGVPLLYGVDAVHGHTNVYGATVFPHNIGLGATGDPELVRRVARVTAEELIATGVRWDFAPPVSVPQDIRWGRTMEAYSEDPALVTELGVAFLRGLQDAGGTGLAHPRAVLGCVKHFIADGGTHWGSAGSGADIADAEVMTEERRRTLEEHENQFGELYDHGRWGQRIDQGNATIAEDELRRFHLPPYLAALQNGARTIMVSLSSWKGVKLHGHRHLLTDVLKGELGFDGFLVSDWLAVEYLDPDYTTAVATGINAGLDMVMVPHDWRKFMAAVIESVESGAIPMERIDDAVTRILRVKEEVGLFAGVGPDPTLIPSFGSAEHRAVAREAVAKSVVLLKNEGAVPLPKDARRILVAGRAADDVGLQCGGWTIEWRGLPGGDIPGTSLLAAINATVDDAAAVHFDPDGHFDGRGAVVGIVVVAEPPYAEMTGDRADLTLPAAEIALIERMRAQCETLIGVVYSGRPLLITDQLRHFDALLAAWLPGSEGAGVADVLFGDVPFSGRLPFAWPRDAGQVPLVALEASPGPLWPRGYGLEARMEPSRL